MIKKNGWEVYKANDISKLELMRDNLIIEFKRYGIKSESINDLREIISNLEESDLNNIKINFNINCASLIAQVYSDQIRSISGNNIFLQKKPHLQINSPNKIKTVTPPHADIIFGHSPETYTIWTPFHDVNDDAGLFCVDQDESVKLMISEEEFGDQFSEEFFNIDEYRPIKLKFGESIVFNSLVVHGAWLNKSPLSRISMDTRFQSIHSKLFEKNIDYFETYKFD